MIASECIAYEKDRFDTHATVKDGIFTAPKHETYIIDGKKVTLKAGDKVTVINYAIGEHCPWFAYKRLKDEPSRDEQKEGA